MTNPEIEGSARHWISFLLAVCNRLDFRFKGVEPDPIGVLEGVVSGATSFEDLERQRDDWARTLKQSPDYFNPLVVEILPLRLAALMADIRAKHIRNRQTIATEMKHVGEWIDFSFLTLGYDPAQYKDLWATYWSDWEIAGQTEERA
ncbi:hypothetical protein [Roseibium sediminicola]|uniref:Uncharacterized protein n=1 Tax=Roseibium sediminicola TaxID=2933272 RepID=A0ABT0GU68_9HYPH|nr:hypothetical protein [Roseibium sp. CAU 1639]MCK7612983.1 hypothetical protein [Roseibium sp. CAU 1639]